MPGFLLTVRHLKVEFVGRRGVLTALDDVSFDIDRGETLGLVGESGAGKSVTGGAIIGLLAGSGRLAGGEIWLDRVRIDGMADARLRRIRGRRIGTIFQDPATSLNPLISIGGQLVETIQMHLGLSARAARARAIALLADTGIPEPERRIDFYPHEFSGGMRQRVVIALALCGEPELVIADEPTTALDVSVQAQILTLLKRLCQERQTAMLLITHDMGVIGTMADRVAVMYAGRIVEIGPVREVLSNPRHPYSRGLMQAIPPLSRRPERLVQIPGTMPRLAAIPEGCAFHPRCASAFGRCVSERPLPRIAGKAWVSCHLYDSLPTP